MADKKISELPLIQTISGSTVVVPLVHDGTTIQMSVQRLSLFTSQFSATTASNTFIGNQIISGNISVNGTSTFTGNTSVGGNLIVNGKLTAQEIYTEITSASIIFESGSTKFGDDTGDKHEFTGSINVSGSVIYNGVILTNIDANTIQKLQQTTASLNFFTASQIGKDGTLAEVTSSLRYFYQTTSSLHAFTASQIGKDGTLAEVTSSLRFFYQTTSSLHAFTASQIGKDGTLSEVTSSLRYFYQTTSSLHAFTQSLNTISGSYATTGSNGFVGNQKITGSLSISAGQFNVTTGSGQLTSSLTFTHNITAPNDGNAILEVRHNNDLYNDDVAIKLKADFAGAYIDYEEDGVPYPVLSVQSFANKNVYIHQDTRLLFSNLTVDDYLTVQKGLVIGTGSLLVNGVITGSILATNGVISSSNQLFQLNAQTGSQDLVNLGISSITGSLIGITNTLMGFTASLDNTYATDAQLYQLYQATASIQFTTRSLNLQTGSQDLVNLAISTYTGSQNVINSSVDSHILKQATQTGSQDLVNLGISTYTGSQNVINTSVNAHILKQATQTGSQDLVNLGISSVTGSLIGITNGLMAFTAALDSTYATDAQLYQLYAETASIKAEIGGIELYTASLKAASIVSSSTQVQNYDVFALNSNLYNSTGSIKGEIAGIEAYTASLKGAIEVSGQNVNVLGMITAQQFNVTYVSSSVMYQSGSNKFGNSFDDKHEFTGSVNVNGGITGSLLATNGVISSSNQIPELFPLMQATASINVTTSSLNTFTGSIRGEVSGIEAYTSSLKSAFSVSGTTTTHSGPINLSDSTIYSHFSQPANVSSGNTTVYTYTQLSGEYCVGFEYSIMSLYAPSGTNLFGVAHGFAFFMADGSTNASYISQTVANGWTVTHAATNAGSFTITFTAGGSATHSNINLRVRKINRIGAG